MRLSPFSRKTVHVVIDMQRLFAEPLGWYVPALLDILPNVVTLCERSGPATIYTRFITPPQPALAPGRWKALYARWPEVSSNSLPAEAFDLVESLLSLSVQGSVIDKMTYSVFAAPGFAEQLRRRETDTIILTGVETDICVHATLVAAVDLGLRVVVATDAVISSDLAAHFSTLDLLARRLPEQVELATTSEILAAWPQ